MSDGANTLDAAVMRARYDAARDMVRRLCLPRGNIEHRDWLMSIPADEARDPDLLIAAALADVPALLDALAQAEAEHLAAYQRVIRENDDCWRQVKTLMERITALAAIAHDLADQEHGARCEQISALARLGIIVTPAEHVQRADAQQAAHHRCIDTALADAAPATREE